MRVLLLILSAVLVGCASDVPAPVAGPVTPLPAVAGCPSSFVVRSWTERAGADFSEEHNRTFKWLSTASPQPGHVTLGHVEAHRRVRVDVETPSTGCPLVVVQAGWPRQVLRVAKELQAHYCPRGEVYRHELEHQEIFKKWEARAVKELPDVLKTAQPESIEQVVSIIGKFLDRARAEHDTLDARDYPLNATMCGGIVPRLIKRHATS